MTQYLYIAELKGTGGDIAVPVVSGNPLSPMEIKKKLIPWLKSNPENWEFVGWSDATNQFHLYGYDVSASKEEQVINFFSSLCDNKSLQLMIEAILGLDSIDIGEWNINLHPVMKSITS